MKTDLIYLSLLVSFTLLTQTEALNLDRLRRVSDTLKEGWENRVEETKCKEEGMACRGLPKCCGDLVCYWPDGYSVMDEGYCKECVHETGTCQRDSQCCSDLQCNKGNALWVDGTCEIYRREGDCYRDGQCVNDCVKEWYETHGVCT